MARQQIVAGFIPLLDSAVLVAAAETGFAEAEGLELKLVRETSWANIRDRIAVGHFDVAHMLAPMPIAAGLNLTSLAVPMRAPMVLGLGGNAVTVSVALGQRMEAAGWSGEPDPAAAGQALAGVVRARGSAGEPVLRFGVVHPFSGHAYELRYWLAASGIDPDIDVEISVLPPPVMPDALATSQIDGYCVGEPWNTIAVQGGHGRIVTYKQAIWPNSPEKVLGVTERWAEAYPDRLAALIRALSSAAEWCADPKNHAELDRLLSAPRYLGCSGGACLPALGGRFPLPGGGELLLDDFFRFVSREQALPRRAHGLWFYSQMLRWGQATYSAADVDRISAIFDAVTARRALSVDGANAQANVSFFDGWTFDPDRPDAGSAAAS